MGSKHTALDPLMKRSQRTLISAVLSKTQLDFIQLHHPTFSKSHISPRAPMVLGCVLARSVTPLQIQFQTWKTFN